jgi:hypothetical protein
MGPPLLPSVTARSGETTSGAARLRFVSFNCVNRTARQFVREDADDSLDRLETKGRREAPRRCPRETLRGAPSARGVKDASPKGSLTSFPGEVDYRVRVREGPVEQILHPSKDRVPYLSVSESHRRGGPPNWTSRQTISPRMSRYPRASATDLTKGGGSTRGGKAGTPRG